MLSHLRESLALSSQGIPRRWLIIPYEILLKLVRQRLEPPACDVWLRNSLANNYWEFAQSDLDLTVWISGGMQDAALCWPSIKASRNLLLGGEIHIFPSDLVPKYVAYANPLELKRDSVLARRLNFERAPTKYEKIVFLVKSLLSDKKLATQPDLRKKKWHFILSSVEKSFDKLPMNFNQEYVIREFLKPLAPWLDGYSVKDISQSLGTHRYAEMPTRLDKMLKPNQYPWFDPRIEGDFTLLEGAGPDFQEFLFSMICWEIWGIFPLVQLTCGLSLLQLSQHTENQTRLINLLELSEDRKVFLKNGFSQLRDDYSLIRDSF